VDVGPDQFDALLLRGTPLLDVRAPVEFERGAIPGAENRPLLDDDERHRIGIRYKESGQDAAIELGHELVTGAVRERRTRAWCEWLDANPDGVLYCFRGGLRSRMVQQWVGETGRDLPLVAGGYKALRAHLLERLETRAAAIPALVLGGRTGTGKTRVLATIPHSLDLEGLAHHRGSAFGPRARPQPVPIDFENALALRLMQLHADAPGVPVAVEDESRNVGRLHLPATLHERMTAAPLVLLEASVEERVEVTLQEYVVDALAEHRAVHGEGGFEALAEHLLGALGKVRRRLGGVRHGELDAGLRAALDHQRATGETDAHRGWIRRMLVEYYDPMYDHQLASKTDRVVFRGDAAAVREWILDAQRRGDAAAAVRAAP
jgi:tRNA 2-selenouridine synthase